MAKVAVKSAHSDTGASGMDRWANCPGSVHLSARMPKTSSVYADEGTKAHELADLILMGKPLPPEIDSEMLEAVEVYTNYVKDIWKTVKPHELNRFVSELKFAHPDIHPGFRGTADSVMYDGNEKVLYVTDYKHGMGVPVDAVENKQLCYYGIGALLSFKVPIKRIVLTIVQPRYSIDDAVKTWEIDPVDLMEFLDDLITAIKETEKPNAALNPGDKQCQWCSAKPICPALKEKVQLAAERDFAVEKLVDLSPEVMGELLSNVDVIKSWCKGVESFAYSEAVQGRVQSGYKMVPKRATRKWIDVNQAAQKFGSHVNSNTLRELMTDPELKPPAQVEKILGKDGKALVAELCVSVSSGDTLVPLNDVRQETNTLDKAKAAFLT